MKSMDTTSTSHTTHKYPMRFSEANKALVRVELGVPSIANTTWVTQSMELRGVQSVRSEDAEAGTSGESEIRIVEDDSIVDQL